MTLLGGLVYYFGIFVVMLGVVVGGVFTGKKIRDIKDKKEA